MDVYSNAALMYIFTLFIYVIYCYNLIQVTELSMGELLMHSTVTWLNPFPSLGKARKDLELTVFGKCFPQGLCAFKSEDCHITSSHRIKDPNFLPCSNMIPKVDLYVKKYIVVFSQHDKSFCLFAFWYCLLCEPLSAAVLPIFKLWKSVIFKRQYQSLQNNLLNEAFKGGLWENHDLFYSCEFRLTSALQLLH